MNKKINEEIEYHPCNDCPNKGNIEICMETCADI